MSFLCKGLHPDARDSDFILIAEAKPEERGDG
jgi:hypothetical protein